ncbi:MAG: hypothetical protein M3Y65_07140 [Pseudomonadota bacterium]|nr:hypothetical protein [Pseudomonadota bacterium]
MNIKKCVARNLRHADIIASFFAEMALKKRSHHPQQDNPISRVREKIVKVCGATELLPAPSVLEQPPTQGQVCQSDTNSALPRGTGYFRPFPVPPKLISAQCSGRVRMADLTPGGGLPYQV